MKNSIILLCLLVFSEITLAGLYKVVRPKCTSDQQVVTKDQ